MTNISLLPQLGIVNSDSSISPAQFYVVTNADWRDVLTFTQANGVSPLDLTGISFEAKIRSSPGDVNVFLSLSTTDGTLINGGKEGTLSWAVIGKEMRLPVGQLVMDILATADGETVNLFAKAGPAIVNVRQGIT